MPNLERSGFYCVYIRNYNVIGLKLLIKNIVYYNLLLKYYMI